LAIILLPVVFPEAELPSTAIEKIKLFFFTNLFFLPKI
jgi:hypothetical protein